MENGQHPPRAHETDAEPLKIELFAGVRALQYQDRAHMPCSERSVPLRLPRLPKSSSDLPEGLQLHEQVDMLQPGSCE